MFKWINYLVYKSLREENKKQLETKNKKLLKLIGRSDEVHYTNASVPVINLSSVEYSTECFRHGLDHSYIDKNKYVKRNIAVEFEALALSVDGAVKPENKEAFHEFLRSHTNTFSQNVFRSNMIKNRNTM